MNKSTIGTGFTFLAALALVAFVSQQARAADIFEETIAVPRDCEEHEIIPILDDGKELGRGLAVACNDIVDIFAEANPVMLDINPDFEFQVNLRSNGTLIRGISDNSVADGPEVTFVDDPGGNLSVQVVVSVF
jgi:hypothetical protein